jgi:hypothetical protein
LAYKSRSAVKLVNSTVTSTIEKDIIQQLTLNQEKNDFITKGQWINAFQVEASLFSPCNNNTAFGGDSLASNL